MKNGASAPFFMLSPCAADQTPWLSSGALMTNFNQGGNRLSLQENRT
jgi:hypothetical protein